MAFYLDILLLICIIQRINLFLIISMKLRRVDDCLRKIELDDGTILYEQNNAKCDFDENSVYEMPIFTYELGQIIKIIIGDHGGGCGFFADIFVNNMDIFMNNIYKQFWSCENCEGSLYYGDYMINCYNYQRPEIFENFAFYFQISSLQQLGFQVSEYYYFLNNNIHFFISSDDFDNAINLIDLHSENNLYAKNKEGNIEEPKYKKIYYKLFFDKYSNHKGKFFGYNESNNILLLNEGSFSRIDSNYNLRYLLSDEEKNNKGVHLRLKIGIFNNQKKLLSKLQDFNFYICLKDYKFCDLETSMKCLKEGYYQLEDRNYSCYETCKTCDTYRKPITVDYFKHYCDECKNEYSYFINIKEDEQGKEIEYKSCYRECPSYAPELKDFDRKECVLYCPRYKTYEGKCLNFCDYEFYRYLLKNESICYNFIPKNYFIYIDNYTEFYFNTDKPIIKLDEDCPDNTYDSSFNNYCINLEEDIFHFVRNPNELLAYNNPLIKRLKKKEMIIRAYSSNIKLDNIDNNKDRLIQIDTSHCENKIKDYYNLNNEKPLIIQDVFNFLTKEYFYRIYTKEGKELDYTLCANEDIIIKELYYKIDKPENTTLCPKDFPYFQIEANQCLKKCDILSFLNKSCTTDDLTEDNQINNINNIKRAIEEHSIDGLLDNIVNGGNDITIEEQNIKYQISSSFNQNNINNENISNIKIGKCENILKEIYNISLEISLLIFKLDIDIEGYSTPVVEYEIYNPITKEKLNLKYCHNEQIGISIPASINENELFKYNPKSEFYNDICTTYTSNYKTDVSLKDRQKEFLNKNMTLCENNCNYASYNFTLKKVECKCDVKYKIKDLYEIKIDKDKLKANFNLINLINIKVLKCYKKLFTRKGLFYNIGSYILLSTIFLYILCLIYLTVKDYSFLLKEIKEIFHIYQTNNNNLIKKFKNKNKTNFLKTKASIAQSNSKIIENDFSYPPPIFNKLLFNNKILNKNALTVTECQNQNKQIINKITIKKYSLIKANKRRNEKLFMIEYELNELSYTKALLYDKRTFCQYFFSLLKSNHLLFFAIIPSRDYNSQAIKICIFLFSFALFFVDNAIFMNEDAIHNIYEDQGTFDIIYQIPQIIYSNIISFIIETIIRFLSLTQADVINEKKKLRKKKTKEEFKKFSRVLIIKYILFFNISFLFLLFFWIYISCFCYVYKNTQIHLIKDTLFSFGISLSLPFAFYLLSAALRLFSLKKRKRNFIYILSKLILF